MKNNYENIEEMVEVIEAELNECELSENYNCKECPELEGCYLKASMCSSAALSENLNYGGYNTEEEFWENLN